MKVSELLAIDAEAELRKLGAGALEGPWQVPAELVRRAIAAGARRIRVEITRGRLVVHDDGRPLTAAQARDLALMLDAARPAGERHAALRALETEPELLSIAAVRPARVVVHTDGGGNSLTVLGGRLDRDAARRWLRSCARFAPGRITVDGVPLAAGFDGVMAERPLEPPLSGRLAITADATAHLWLLGAGVVSTHLTLPDTPGFEAAIELPRGAPSALREAVEPHMAAIVDQAIRLTLEAAVAGDVRDEARTASLRSRLLVAARRGWHRPEIFRAPLVPAVRADGTPVRLCLSALGGPRPVACLEPGDDPHEFLLPAEPVIVIDAEERGRLAQLLSIRFRPVERRRTRLDLAAWLRRAWRAVGASAGTALARLVHPGGRRVLPETALIAEERAFLRAVRAARPEGALPVTLTAGGAPPVRTPEGWRLPRSHPDVRRAVRLVARSPECVYVALLSLCDDAVPLPAAREAWAARIRGGAAPPTGPTR